MSTSAISPVSDDRARGALIGLAVGDALGTTLEFAKRPPAPFPGRWPDPHKEITGGGPFNMAPGQVTDDTAMAACIAASLARHGEIVISDIAHRYVVWSRVTFDIGNQTSHVLSRIAAGADPTKEALAQWRTSPPNLVPAGNGSLMRTAPLAVFFAEEAAARRDAVIADGLITHADPRCILACLAFDAAIARALGGGGVTAMFEAARREIAEMSDAVSARVDAAATRAAIDALSEDLDHAESADPRLYEGTVHLTARQGFVRVAFRLAFWQLAHARSFEEGLVDTVNRGGDADTNGAITGALLGAQFGESNVPPRWRDTVMSALQDRPPGPFRDDYHPNVLLRMLAARP